MVASGALGALGAMAIAACGIAACGDGSGTGDGGDASDGEVSATCVPQRDPDDGAFDDHTVLGFQSVACLEDWAGTFATDPLVLKFQIVDFPDVPGRGAHGGEHSQVRYDQGGFYDLHDEWYWFRLLNGHPIPDLATPAPVTGSTYPDVASIYAAFAGQPSLPLDLKFIDGTGAFAGRLYSTHYYALAGLGGESPTPPRFFGMGTVLHYAPDARRHEPGEIWGFDLEYLELVTEDSVAAYFAHLRAHLPPAIADQLRWVAKSPQQQNIAKLMRLAGGPLADKILTYDDLVVDGAVEVYNGGIAAGFVHILEPDHWSAADVAPDDIVILPLVPDDVPPTRAMVSGVPETPLAHVNLLAKSRGTPNAYVAGIQSWGQLDNWSYTHTPVIFSAGDDGVRWKAMTAAEYNGYTALLTPPHQPEPPVVDIPSLPVTVPLDVGDVDSLPALMPIIGGKAAGMVTFLSVPGMSRPDDPMGGPIAISIRPYAEHMASLFPAIRALVAAPDFDADARVRYLCLEGEKTFRETNANNPPALAWLTMFLAAHAHDPAYQPILAAGSVKELIRQKPLDEHTRVDIMHALADHFAFLAPTQALRVRSSATSEGAIGFNAEGLYDSNPAYIHPDLARDPSEKNETVEWAMKKTWASYWRFHAFEERRSAGVDHFKGNMGLIVNSRFDDDKELANGIITTRYTGWTDPPSWRFTVDMQYGTTSVALPEGSTDLPEIDEVEQVGDAAPVIKRVEASTLVPSGTLLMPDADLLMMFEQSKAHLLAWLHMKGEGLGANEAPRSLVLDYEVKRMGDGWPELASGEVRPAHLLWKETRVLDSAPRILNLADSLLGAAGSTSPVDQSMPEDLRPVAFDVRAEECVSPVFTARFYGVVTDASSADQFPFAETPLVYKLWLDFTQTAAGYTWPATATWVPGDALTSASAAYGGALHATLAQAAADAVGLDELSIGADGAWTLRRGAQTLTGQCSSRTSHPLYQSPATYLRGLLDAGAGATGP
ncbi:MAG: PEP/pyruvate-binding domain-containing protein [Myxococcota bacterium]